MKSVTDQPPVCPIHGPKLGRAGCLECNAAYMRRYQRRRRRADPIKAMLERAQKRARERNIPFDLKPEDLSMPSACPVLGIPVTVGGRRSDNSPTLDRVIPYDGYVRGNVRIISNRANNLKSTYEIEALRFLRDRSIGTKRWTYDLLVHYVERELLLRKVLSRALNDAPKSEEWEKIFHFLDRRFQHIGEAPIIAANENYPIVNDSLDWRDDASEQKINYDLFKSQ